MKIKSIKIIQGYDRDTPVYFYINDVEITSTNYDEHGSAGYYILCEMAENLSKLSGVKLEIEEVE
jgi:hypothetical protein